MALTVETEFLSNLLLFGTAILMFFGYLAYRIVSKLIDHEQTTQRLNQYSNIYARHEHTFSRFYDLVANIESHVYQFFCFDMIKQCVPTIAKRVFAPLIRYGQQSLRQNKRPQIQPHPPQYQPTQYQPTQYQPTQYQPTQYQPTQYQSQPPTRWTRFVSKSYPQCRRIDVPTSCPTNGCTGPDISCFCPPPPPTITQKINDVASTMSKMITKTVELLQDPQLLRLFVGCMTSPTAQSWGLLYLQALRKVLAQTVPPTKPGTKPYVDGISPETDGIRVSAQPDTILDEVDIEFQKMKERDEELDDATPEFTLRRTSKRCDKFANSPVSPYKFCSPAPTNPVPVSTPAPAPAPLPITPAVLEKFAEIKKEGGLFSYMAKMCDDPAVEKPDLDNLTDKQVLTKITDILAELGLEFTTITTVFADKLKTMQLPDQQIANLCRLFHKYIVNAPTTAEPPSPRTQRVTKLFGSNILETLSRIEIEEKTLSNVACLFDNPYSNHKCPTDYHSEKEVVNAILDSFDELGVFLHTGKLDLNKLTHELAVKSSIQPVADICRLLKRYFELKDTRSLIASPHTSAAPHTSASPHTSALLHTSPHTSSHTSSHTSPIVTITDC